MSAVPNPLAPSRDALAAADFVTGAASWADRFVDRLNPIFVKETRQAVKSKQFFGAFSLLLLVSWLISLVSVTAAGQSLDYGDWGRDLFACYFVVLAAAILIVVPFGAYRSLMVEREESTYEPLIISTLTPRQIVFGKLWSALLQAFLFYSAIAPFMAFTALLQGFDIAYVSMLLGLGLGVSAWMSMAALAISSMIRGRMWQTIVSLVVLFQLVSVFGFAWALAFETWWLNWQDPWVIAGMAAWIAGGLASIVLLQEVAVVNLTFQADNRSTGLRVICQTQVLLIWIGALLAAWFLTGMAGGHAEELLLVGVILGLMLWTAAGLFFVTEPDTLSQRIIRRLPQRAAVRLLLAPYYPGGNRGLVLLLGNVLLHAVALAGIIFTIRGTGWDDEFLVLAGALLYLVLYLNMGAALSRWGMAWSDAISPAHCRVATLVFIGMSMVAPMFLLLFDSHGYYRGYSLLYITNPGLTLEELDRNSTYSESILVMLSASALLATVVNIPAMARGLHEMVVSQPLPREIEQAGDIEGVVSVP